MAAPTAIPHPETSAHHRPHPAAEGTAQNGSILSRSPTGTSPRSMVSPIYTQAGRSSFSLPGPNSNSTSPTTTTWYSAGFASGNSQRVRSPTAPFSATSGAGGVSAITSAVSPQRDSFPELSKSPSHFRASSFGSASNTSSLASDEPTTPLGRASSIGQASLGTSYEQMKTRRDSWSFANAQGNRWSGLASLRERTSAPTVPVFVSDGDNDYNVRPPISGGLLRKFSIGGNQPLKSPPLTSGAQLPARSAATTTPPIPASVPVTVQANEDSIKVPQQRGRQGSIGAASSQRRRPSPMGERLLMGHFNSH